MEVSLFLPSLAGGGAERVLLTVARELRQRNLRTEVVVAKAVGPLLDEASDIPIADLGAGSLLSVVPRLAGYLRRRRPKVLLSTLRHANLVAILANRMARTGTRVILREANTASVVAANGRSWRAGLIPVMMRWLYPRADGIIAVSHGVAVDLAEHTGLAPEMIRVIYNPTVTPDLSEGAKELLDEDLAQLKADGHLLIMGAGRLVPVKDFPTMIRAFARVRAKIDRAVLVILGDGPERGALESLAGELGLRGHVLFRGFVSNPFRYMAAADVFVLTSRCEGLPNVLIQALACGCQVVSTDCPSGPREILCDGRYGHLVAMGADGDVAEAILAAIQAPKDPAHLMSRADDFSADRIMPAYAAYLHDHLASTS